MGLGPLAQRALGVDGGVDRCSKAYKAGEYGSMAIGFGRAAYAAVAKALPFIVRAGETELSRALAVSAARNTLKRVARTGTFPNYKMYTPEQILERYGPNAEAIIDAATRTSPRWNAMGIDAAAGGAANAANGADCGCR